MIIQDFLCPRLEGKRFKEHSIPLELLGDLAVLEPMIIEVAKWRYLQDNPSRKRSPRGFTDGVTLRLTKVGEGSAVPKIALVLGMTGSLLAPQQVYFERAREAIIGAIDAASENRSPTDLLPPKGLMYFDRLGRSLLDDESIEFDASGREAPARLTKETRLRLLKAAEVTERSEEIHLRGRIHMLDHHLLTFEIMLSDGSKVPGKIAKPHRDTIKEAFNSYEQGVKVQLDGVGIYNRNDRLQRIDSIEHLTLLDPLDIQSQFDDLRALKDGWYDGLGQAPSATGLNWLAEMFNAYDPDIPALPYVYPVVEGAVRLEWTFGSIEASLEVDLNDHTGEWHSIDLLTDEDEERPLSLDEENDWGWLVSRLQDISSGVAL